MKVWPPQSSDLNPIEHVRYMLGHSLDNEKSLKTCVLKFMPINELKNTRVVGTWEVYSSTIFKYFYML